MSDAIPESSLSNLSGNFSEFVHDGAFAPAEATGHLRLGRLEVMYEELFAEVIEDGVITTDERKRLDKMAENFGLDRQRLARLEAALQAAYEARNKIVIRDLSESFEDAPQSLMPLEPATDQRTLALERRVRFLEERVRQLQAELEDARAQVNVEVDLSDLGEAKSNAGATVELSDDPADIARRLRHDPRDTDGLHALYKYSGKDLERRYAVAQVLDFLGRSTDEERAFFETHKPKGLIRPSAALSQDAWRRLLFHPEEEPLVGEIFSVVVSAVLLGRVSALRRDKALVKLDAAHRQDPKETTLQAVRCMHWGAAILGLQAPEFFADPSYGGTVEMVPGMPPASRVGKKALSGLRAPALAFLAGRHLAHYREEHFVKLIVPGVKSLEEVFLASLSIGNPGLPLNTQTKQLVIPIAKAIEPILEAPQIDRLRGAFLRFVEEGGRTNLQRWSAAVDRTCNRAGLLLGGDLHAAQDVLTLEGDAHVQEQMDDLLGFVLSDRYAKLRRQLGIALGDVA
jgi:hypothetical protein